MNNKPKKTEMIRIRCTKELLKKFKRKASSFDTYHDALESMMKYPSDISNEAVKRFKILAIKKDMSHEELFDYLVELGEIEESEEIAVR